jgi:hypothetical protein
MDVRSDTFEEPGITLDAQEDRAGYRRDKLGRWCPTHRKPVGQGRPRKSRAVKLRIASFARNAVDGRSRARRHFDRIATGVISDLGSADQLSTVQKALVEAFAGIACHVHDINARLLNGEKINIDHHCTAVSVMCRTASRIGLHRVPREIESLSSILRRDVAAHDVDVDASATVINNGEGT